MWFNHNNQRAVTLIEVLVASAVMLIALAVALGSFVHTSSSVLEGQDRLAMQNSAQLIARNVVQSLRYSVPAEALDMDLDATELVFESDHMLLISSEDYTNSGLEWVEIETEDRGNEGFQIGMRRSPLGVLPSKESPRLLNLAPNRFSALLSLRYRLDAASSETFEALEEGQYPELVEIKIIMRDNEKKIPDYTLETAVELL